MTYSTSQNMIDAFGEEELIQLTDRPDSNGQTTGAIVTTVLDAAITKAAKRIDGYLSPRYDLPLQQSSIDASSLTEMACYIVRKILYDDAPTEAVKDDYKDALAWLRDVQSGKVTLGVEDSMSVDTGRVVQKPGESTVNWDTY